LPKTLSIPCSSMIGSFDFSVVCEVAIINP
jgi:hypothetical protein